MNRLLTLSIDLLFIVVATGCSMTLPAIRGEYPIVSGEPSPTINGSTQTKLLIFNASSPVMFSATGRLNVTLNGKGAAQLDIWEYLELLVPRGKYRVDLVHHDMISFSSSHDVELNAPSAYLEVKATIVSNSAQVVSELPADFKDAYYKK